MQMVGDKGFLQQSALFLKAVYVLEECLLNPLWVLSIEQWRREMFF